MFICTFNISGSRLRRYSSGVIYEKTHPNTVFKFNFNTTDWDIYPTKTAVFSYRGCNYSEPLDENNMCRVPEEVLHEGHFLVSVQDGQGLLTNHVRVPVVPIPKELEPDTPSGGNSGPTVVYVPTVDERKILSWTIQEVTENMPVPSPVDLLPHVEWSTDETENEYIWEEE